MVASSLYAFGYVEGNPGAIVYDALRTILGPQATIVVPSYQSNSHAEAVWHAKTSPGMNVGLE